MQVNNTLTIDRRRTSGNIKSGKKGVRSIPDQKEATPFQQILETVLPPDDVESYDMLALWNELPDIERKVIEFPTDENLDYYKDLVKRIAAATLKKNTSVKKLKRKNQRGETFELSVMQIIDKRLQQMTNMMHSPRNSAFQLLSTLNEIRGLLLDIRN